MTTGSQITSTYQRILFRDPSVAELNSWIAAVDGSSVPLSDVRASLIASTEASNFVDPVIRLYQAAFGRVPESNDALDYYADRLRDGRMSVFTMAQGFAASPEFADRYGAGGPNGAFITAL
jgi:hypothetical protein